MAEAATPFSFTAIRTGFLRPALTSFSNSCVWVAENKPVRLCLGRWPKMAFRLNIPAQIQSVWQMCQITRCEDSGALFSPGLEPHIKKPISFIKNQHFQALHRTGQVQTVRFPLEHILQTSWSSNYNVGSETRDSNENTKPSSGVWGLCWWNLFILCLSTYIKQLFILVWKTLLIFVNIPLILELFHVLYWITATNQ